MYLGAFCFLVLSMGIQAKKVDLRPNMEVDLSEMPAIPDLPKHSHQSVLDPDGIFTVFWTPDLEKQEVTIELHVKTLGWFGFGFSSNGNMRGADILTAWVKDGRLHMQDRHGIGETMPPVDDHADWRPIYARENDTHTVLVVVRDVNTCDPQDFVLTNETVRMIYAWDDQDPVGDSINYHGQKRGNRFALMLLPFHRATVTKDINTWKIRQSIEIPHHKDTFYWCHIERVPRSHTKHHYIGFDMVYGKNSHTYLHHAVAMECVTRDGSPTKEIFEKYVDHPGYECYTPNMPPDFYLCERFLINWAVGSEGELLPDHVGYPLGDLHGGTDFILFQTHYDNQPLHRDITVEWGMDIYYTDKLREHDAGNIGLGHAITFSLTVPPMTPHWMVAGHCSSECTSQALPKDGINVFMVFLHGHYLARAIRMRHFRGGRELKPISVDTAYDADFQQSRMLSEEVKIFPGDHLTVECDYDSLNRDNGTYSGWASDDEMCQGFINYYPRNRMALCRSLVHPDTLKNNFYNYGIKRFSNDLDLYDYILNPEVGGGRKYQEVMNSVPWNSLDKEALNEKLLRSDQMIKCQYNFGQALELNETFTGYPKAIPYQSPEDPTCSRRKDQGQDLSYTLVGSPDSSPSEKPESSETKKVSSRSNDLPVLSTIWLILVLITGRLF